MVRGRRSFTFWLYVVLLFSILTALLGLGYLTFKEVQRSMITYITGENAHTLRAVKESTAELYERARSVARVVSQKSELRELLEAGARDSAMALCVNLMHDLGMDYLVVVDQRADVFLRAHQPERHSDNIGNQTNVQTALAGRNEVYLENGKLVKYSVRGSAPIYNRHGRIIGAVSTGYVLGRPGFVNRLKSTHGVETSIFYGDSLLQTTIEPLLGSGYQADPRALEQVLVAGQECNIIGKVRGQWFVSDFFPIIGPDQRPWGMFWFARSLEPMNRMLVRLAFVELIVAIVALILACVWMAWAVRRLALNPIRRIIKQTERCASGDLRPFEERFKDNEFGQLSYMVSQISDRFRNIVAQLQRASSTMTQTMDTVMDGARVLQETSEEMATTGEQLSSSLTNITGLVSSNSELSNAALREFEALAGAVQRGLDAAHRAGEQIRQMGELTKSIDEIAQQTNILALNAAVEAARAGEAGAGFGVVAHEVGALAGKSSEAVAQVKMRIQSSVAVTHDVLDVLESLIPLGERSGQAIGQVNDSGHEQAARMVEVDLAARQYNEMVQRNASQSDALTSSADTVNGIVREIEQLVSTFRVE